MALPLPAVLSPAECAEYGRVVSPYLSQLSSLPARFLDSGTDVDALKELYINTNPMVMAIGFALALVPILVFTSEISRNYSQVDRLWSILPFVYNAHFAVWARLTGLPTKRIDTVVLWCLFWSVSCFLYAFANVTRRLAD
jgi:steroid 5-alpha reductase family enzyme